MARPGILRADTLDLQDHEAPSAKNHPHPHPQPHPHNGQQQQDDAWGSGRSSHEGSELLEEDADFLTDGGTVPMDLRGGHDQSGTNRSSEDSDMTDGDEDGADDDLVDKISSSPSINDDGEFSSSYTSHLTFNPAFSPDDSPFSVTNAQEKNEAFQDKKTFSRDRKMINAKLLRGKGTGSAPYSPSASESPKPRSSRPPSPALHFNDEGQIDAAASPSRLRSFIEGIKAKYNEAAGTVPSMPSHFSLGSISLSSEGANDEDEDPTQEDEDDYLKDPEHNAGDLWEESVTESLHEQPEDIDFEFVYALHTFVATVEGQANATKGDTMVLLDDSNSYWWLVRVVKDSSIGYLPAEHIETPTERLARLNKHRNADVWIFESSASLDKADSPQLAQQMLTDSSEKSKNPLKKAMRRRNAKMVQFTAPTYYEASENEWSDAEEDQDGDMDIDSRPNGEAQQNGDHSATSDSATSSASAAAPSTSTDVSSESAADPPKDGLQDNAPTDAAAQERGLRIDPDQANREAFDAKDAPSISKNGNIRNTDSFFKDDTAEPKKMSLTPTLLRDSENATADSPRTSEQAEPSPISDTFEQLDKSTSPTSDKFREDKKKKEKKPGMLSGLFKRKDKKIKVDEAAGGTVRSSKDGETLLGSPTSSPGDSAVATPAPERAPQPTRKSSGNKLVKSPPQSAISASTSSTSTAAASSTSLGVSTPSNGALKPAPLSPNLGTGGTSALSQTGSDQQRGLAPSSAEALNGKPTGLRVQTGGSPSEKKEGGLLSPLSNLLPQSDQPKKEKLRKAKQRIDLDVDSSPERESNSPVANSRNAFQTTPSRHAASTTYSEATGDGLVSPVDKHPPSFDSLGNARSHSPVSRSPTPTETASTVQTPQSEPEPKTSTAASSTVPPDHHATGSEESSDTQWDDVALRNYLDERGHDDTRDLLIRVHDRSEVVPLPDNHPTMIELGFHETQAQLDAMSAQLDAMLYSFLDRCAARRAAREASAAPAAA